MRKPQRSVEEAKGWHEKQPWLVGCNFIPSTAINQLEMWQADTFDPETIDRELGWAAGIGFNAVRVYLHDLAYDQDPDGFLQRMDRFLRIADAHGIKTLFVIFDDCWLAEPKVGKQPEPWPGVHNSGWLESPGLPQLKRYPTDSDLRRRLAKYIIRNMKAPSANDPEAIHDGGGTSIRMAGRTSVGDQACQLSDLFLQHRNSRHIIHFSYRKVSFCWPFLF